MILKNSKTTQLAKNRFAFDASVSAIQMSEDGQNWQDIKPQLVRDADGWHIEGVPYYAEIKDDGTRLFCPDRNERSKYFKLPSIPLLTLTKNVLPDRIRMPLSWGYIDFIFTNTGLRFEVMFNRKPPVALGNKFTFNADTAGFDVTKLLTEKYGLGIPRPRLIEAGLDLTIAKERPLDWSFNAGQLELGFDLTGLKFPILLKNTTIDETVGASLDDAHSTTSVNSPTELYVRADTASYEGGFRFQTVNVPNAAIIGTCYLRVWFYTTSFDSPNNAIDFENVDDATDFTTKKPHDQVLTGNPVTWTGTDLGAADYVNSPSLVTPCQAIVDRVGWAANQDMAINVGPDLGTSNFAVFSWDGDAAKAAILHIEYTEAGGAVYIPRVIMF